MVRNATAPTPQVRRIPTSIKHTQPQLPSGAPYSARRLFLFRRPLPAVPVLRADGFPAPHGFGNGIPERMESETHADCPAVSPLPSAQTRMPAAIRFRPPCTAAQDRTENPPPSLHRPYRTPASCTDCTHPARSCNRRASRPTVPVSSLRPYRDRQHTEQPKAGCTKAGRLPGRPERIGKQCPPMQQYAYRQVHGIGSRPGKIQKYTHGRETHDAGKQKSGTVSPIRSNTDRFPSRKKNPKQAQQCTATYPRTDTARKPEHWNDTTCPAMHADTASKTAQRTNGIRGSNMPAERCCARKKRTKGNRYEKMHARHTNDSTAYKQHGPTEPFPSGRMLYGIMVSV